MVVHDRSNSSIHTELQKEIDSDKSETVVSVAFRKFLAKVLDPAKATRIKYEAVENEFGIATVEIYLASSDFNVLLKNADGKTLGTYKAAKVGPIVMSGFKGLGPGYWNMGQEVLLVAKLIPFEEAQQEIGEETDDDISTIKLPDRQAS